MDGICHVYIHEDADLKKALDISINSKTQRTGVCNAMETLIVDKTISSTFIVRVPSLSDLYENVENRESDFMQEMLSDIDEIQDLKEQFEEMELQILKSKELDWDQEQSLKNSIEE